MAYLKLDLGGLGALFLAVTLAGACGSNSSGTDPGASGGSDGGSSSGSSGGGSGGGSGSSSGIGTFGDSGGSSSGSTPPPLTCDPSCQAAGGTCTAGACTISENPGSISTGDRSQLGSGGSADTAFKWLYPYDKTVFPRGLLPLVLQFDGTAYDAALVHVSFTGMDYEGYYGPPSGTLKANQLQLSAPVWTAITSAAQATSAVKVEITKLSGGAVTGPITETWTIAQGTIRGTIYYETYNSRLLASGGGVGIMKIQPGATAPVALKGGCGNVCHTASADGSTLVANVTIGVSSASYDLKNNGAPIYSAPNMNLTYGGIYPDGSFVMSATNYRTWGSGSSLLYDTRTGAQIAATGWTVSNAGTPAFSPDGTMMAFNHGLDSGGVGGVLGVASFDNATKTFSNMTDLVPTSPDPGNDTLAWPAFTPDTKSVLFHAGSNRAFETSNATGNLYTVDVASKSVARLDAADGYTGANVTTSYLPANDPALNFAPTVLPEAVGGYFWAVFTSHRSYGNTTPSKDNGDINGKLWVAAIDMNSAPGKDSSHPAFFLDGQELESDNLRGFWVLDPCQRDGTSCSSGDQCCGGFCRASDDGGLVCLPAPPSGGCSQDYEKCTTAADCCHSQDQCVNGRCAEPAPQ